MQMRITAETAKPDENPQQDGTPGDARAVVMPLLPAACPPLPDDPRQLIPSLRHTLVWQPGSAAHWLQLGHAYLAVSQPGAACDAFRNALRLEPRNVAARAALARALSADGYCIEAAQTCYEGLADNAASMELHQALAEAYMHAGLPEQADTVIRQAMTLDGDGMASSLLAALLYYRQHRIDACLDTLTRLLAAEPGHARARRLQADTLLAAGRAQHRWENAVPVSAPDTLVMAKWQALLAPWQGMKVGLVWADHAAPHALLRSMPLLEYAPLAATPGVTFFSLQLGAAAREAVQPPEGMNCVCLSDALSSPLDVAAALTQMDLVISVDCEIACQAAALGRPIWVLLSDQARAHWLLDREDLPGYPNVRLFRQPRRGEWEPVLRKVAARLLDTATAYAAADRLDDTQKKLAQARSAVELYRHPEAERLYRELLRTQASESDPNLICAIRRYIARTRRYEVLDDLPPPESGPPENHHWRTDLRACEQAGKGNYLAAFLLWESVLAQGVPVLTFLMHHGEAAHNAREWDRANRVWEQAMSLCPDAPLPALRAAYSYKEQGNADKAIACFRRSLALSPCQPMAHHDLGCLLRDQGNNEEALRHFQKALYLHPGYGFGWQSLGHLLYYNGARYRAAAVCFEQSVAVEPGHYAYLHRGYCALNVKDYASAVASLDQALRLSPKDKDTLCHKAQALTGLGRDEECVQVLETLRMVDPAGFDQNEFARKEIFLELLAIQRFDKRCLEYAYWSTRKMSGKRWKGEPLGGKTLIVFQDAGFGDSLQAVRYLAKIKRQYKPQKLVHVVWPELTRLYKNVPGADECHSIFAVDIEKMDCDYFVDEYSLFLVLGIDPVRDAVQVPYLSADPDLASAWKRRLSGDRNFKVGIAWAGNPGHANDKERSSTLEDWLPLADVPGLTLYAVQKGKSTSQAFDVCALPLATPDADIKDFADTAALMSGLDLVISVDSAPAHLAAALGLPVWLLLPSVGIDWRWRKDKNRNETAWYPNMRLFHRMPDQSWRHLLSCVREALCGLVAQRQVCDVP
jgi:tetratricopeptide (TPR) repeat protein